MICSRKLVRKWGRRNVLDWILSIMPIVDLVCGYDSGRRMFSSTLATVVLRYEVQMTRIALSRPRSLSRGLCEQMPSGLSQQLNSSNVSSTHATDTETGSGREWSAQSAAPAAMIAVKNSNTILRQRIFGVYRSVCLSFFFFFSKLLPRRDTTNLSRNDAN